MYGLEKLTTFILLKLFRSTAQDLAWKESFQEREFNQIPH